MTNVLLTDEAAQQIEEALSQPMESSSWVRDMAIALSIIRAARGQGPVQIGWQCAECKAPVREGYTCDVCDSGLAEERYAALAEPVKQERASIADLKGHGE